MKLIDLEDMPGYNAVTDNNRATQRYVSKGEVYWSDKNKVCCIEHRAMLAVNPDCTIWRCIACGRGAYLAGNRV